MKLEFSWHIFEVCVNIKFHENLSSGSRAIPCGQMDRCDKANRDFVQFYEHAQKYVGWSFNSGIDFFSGKL